ncbi:MAG TPA: BatA domain-containing protein, partial [Rhodospirillales bacterium]
MLTLGALSFALPWALAALVVLPVIWWLLRLTPPMPTTIRFPPVRLLMKLRTREESSAKTPPWLLLLRLALAAVLILAAAQPLLNAGARLAGKGPLVVIVDDGWAAAANWPARRATLLSFADQAERQGRPVMLLTTAPGETGAAAGPPRMMSAIDARREFEALQPKPWPTDRAKALAPLLATGGIADARPGDVVWLSDGLEEGAAAKPFADLLPPLQRLGGVTVIADPSPRLAMVLRPPESEGETLKLVVERASADGLAAIQVRAVGKGGTLLARERLTFAGGKHQATAGLNMPTELLNRLTRLEIEDSGTAGAVVLTDERWRRRPVGLVSGAGATGQQPLLSDTYYLERALRPFTEIRRGSVDDLLQRPLAVMVLADPGAMTRSARQRLETWLTNGGVAIRFAGPLLARATGGDGAVDTLLPVRLRGGDRVIGGSMSWNVPAKLAPFEVSSPFHGLPIPADVTVQRQVLAQPALDLADKTWARLDDGTPLVTATKRGKGWLVLVHTTANAEWSNLPLSGLFVDML